MTRRLIGCGEPFRRDDGVGRAVAERLRALAPPGLEIQEASGEAADLVERMKGAPSVILVDAMRSGRPPGALLRLSPRDGRLEARALSSTHGFGPAEALELAAALGVLPKAVEVWGVEGADFSAGQGLTPEVEAAAERLARIIAEETCTVKG